MKLIPIDPENIFKDYVLAYSASDKKLIGRLANMNGSIVCVSHETSLSNITHYLPLDEIKPESEKVLLPLTLTAENGAKALLSGEFSEFIEVPNPEYCGCGECDFCNDFPDTPEVISQETIVSWRTIKAIYSKIVSHFAQ